MIKLLSETRRRYFNKVHESTFNIIKDNSGSPSAVIDQWDSNIRKKTVRVAYLISETRMHPEQSIIKKKKFGDSWNYIESTLLMEMYSHLKFKKRLSNYFDVGLVIEVKSIIWNLLLNKDFGNLYSRQRA